MMKFDCLVTNPPYRDSSHTESKNTLWRKWFSFDSIINDGGVFAEIIPSSWMGSPPLIKNNFLDENGNVSKNITFINRDECEKYFKGIGSNFSYFVYSKEPYDGKTDFITKNIDNSIDSFSANLNKCLFGVFPRDLSKIGIRILHKTLNGNQLIGIENTTICHANNKNKWKEIPIDSFRFPIEKTPNSTIYYNKPHPHQDLKKVLIPTTTYFRSMYITTHGTSQSFCYYLIKDTEDSDIVMHNLNNKLFDYLNECFRYSNWNSVKLLKKLPQIPFDLKLTDVEIYKYFNLTDTEINHIENIVTWR